MFTRTLEPKLQELFQQFPVLGVLGPRQSGKTTLVKRVFPHLPYVSMEDYGPKTQALDDPRGFLRSYPEGLIIDEAQQVPALFSAIQVFVDERDRNSQIILTGSHNFLLAEKIAQSLAGRIALFTLLPLSYQELADQAPEDSDAYILQGSFPRPHRYNITPDNFYPNYIQTYIERDVRLIQSITNLSAFQKFIKLCAGRVGQLLNLSSLANDCGIAQTTAKAWLSVLEASYIVFTLQPYFKNFNKRLTKSPKLYFYDTGVACHLLGIRNKEMLDTHYLKGALFENMIILEILKNNVHHYRSDPLYFWRDQTGHEIDVLSDDLGPIEIKSGQTIHDNFFSSLKFFLQISDFTSGRVVYGGDFYIQKQAIAVSGWQRFLKIDVHLR